MAPGFADWILQEGRVKEALRKARILAERQHFIRELLDK
jgi:hypothetical protein